MVYLHLENAGVSSLFIMVNGATAVVLVWAIEKNKRHKLIHSAANVRVEHVTCMT